MTRAIKLAMSMFALAVISACGVEQANPSDDDVAAVSQADTATSPDDSGSAPQWVTVGTAPAGSIIETLRGTKDLAGNCNFKINMTLAPGEPAVQGDQLRIDVANCVTEIAVTRGDLAVAAIPPAESATATDQGNPVGGSGGSTGDVVPLAYVESRGHLRTYWEDPVGLDVNGVKNTVDWKWNGVNCLSPGWGSYAYDWYSPSGWALKDNNWQNVYDCSRQTSSSYVHYRNGLFCLTIDTHTYYDRNTIRGRWDGYLLAEWNTWNSGGCTGLLSFHYNFRRDLN